MASKRRRICFVTGTRAEFGLMRTTLQAIQRHSRLNLQLIVTGMHLDPTHGRSIGTIRKDGWTIDATVPWPRATTPGKSAIGTGKAIAGLAKAFGRLDPDVVMVVGDRVEAFAAAAAAHIGGRVVAHVHGGDRALGQIDDSLRHAIAKLAHIHFPATAESARRIGRLGEDTWRIHHVGSPGLDGIGQSAAIARFADLEQHRFALLVLHPVSTNDAAEARIARRVLRAILDAGIPRVAIIHPNSDPGGRGIAQSWDSVSTDPRLIIRRDVPRSVFLGLMRDAAMLVGNSSSGIIEAASFGTPVIDIGARQEGRERGRNVVNVPATQKAVVDTVKKTWNNGRPKRFTGQNIYGGDGAGDRIASELAQLLVDDRLLRKLITY
jgi:GDP/UDP-N,N'-diacetylbacillosamine 2-epimerase (hydrolysing)